MSGVNVEWVLTEALWRLECRNADSLEDEPADVQAGFWQDAKTILATMVPLIEQTCADDHGAWREEIENLKGDVELWKWLAESRAEGIAKAERRGAKAALEAAAQPMEIMKWAEGPLLNGMPFAVAAISRYLTERAGGEA